MNVTYTPADTAAGVAAILIVLLILSFGRIVDGMLCKRLAAKKGYTGYFFTGFFLGLLGLLYVHFLPDRKLHRYLWLISGGKERSAGHAADDGPEQ